MNCNVLKDLLPLYFDGLCSVDTRRQMEEHLEHCEECRALKESLEAEQKWSQTEPEWEQTVAPLKKVNRKLRRKNRLIALCLLLLALAVGSTCVLTYGQIAKKGISFELLYEALRFSHLGRQFASGDMDSLYEVLADGYLLRDGESVVIRAAYEDSVSYAADMKNAILEKYYQYFEGRELTYQGIEDIGYRETPALGWERALCIYLKFEGEDGLEYYMSFYQTSDGRYLVDDYFGNPYITYASGQDQVSPQGEPGESFQTKDSLFSCLPNGLKDVDLYMARMITMVYGQRALQGDAAMAEGSGLKLYILSEQDLSQGASSLPASIDAGIGELANMGYYLTDIAWRPLQYDRERHLYRYSLILELTGKDGGLLRGELEGYRISDRFIYISGTARLCGDGLPSEISSVWETMWE
ncbi:MAG: zf-HC2 domain-containing protein [bacterium]|nr:zf-HC2 domain-containing protein [bacterium]MCM1374518.1 zf-HC2 domain-containing protein [Muribaculum sp.]